MPVTVYPADSLTSRLLQQYHRATGGKSASRPAAQPKGDSVNISPQARNVEAETESNAGRLESSLLGLYSNRGSK